MTLDFYLPLCYSAFMASYDPEPKHFGLFAEFTNFVCDPQLSIHDPQAILAFKTHVGNALSCALSNPILIHGKRVEAMFEAMLVSLGGYSLLKVEDTGRVYPEESFKIPDFRIVLQDRTQLLIEVKNVYIEDPLKQCRLIMRRDYREKLENYTFATGGQLKLAVFWARWKMWTLVSPDRLVDANGDLMLDMKTAVAVNELACLGDRMIGTRPPLRFRLSTDPTYISPVAPDGTVTVRFTITDVQIFSDKDEILDPTEKFLAWTFMLHGEWKETGPCPILEGGKLKAIEFRWTPAEPTNSDFEIVGTLSRMFASYYDEQTVDSGEVVKVHAVPQLSWFTPLVPSNYEQKQLPLRQFVIHPNYSSVSVRPQRE